MIKPQEVTITDGDGVERIYVVSRMPATQGREVFTQYVSANIPKVGSYDVSQELMLKLMAFVGVVREGEAPLMLTTKTLVDNHVPDWETLGKLELAMMEHKCSFFRNGKGLNFLKGFVLKAQSSLTETLTALLGQYLPAGKPPSKS